MLTFEPLCLEHREVYQRYMADKPNETSEMTFANLMIWRFGWNIHIACGGDALYLLGSDGAKRRFLFPPVLQCRDGDYVNVMRAAEQILHEAGHPFLLRGVPEWMRQDIERSCGARYRFNHDRDNCDYVYARQDLSELAGKKYHSKRNHISRFLKNYEYRYETLADAHNEACLASYEAWYEKHAPSEELDAERQSVISALEHREALGLSGGVILIGGKVEAFTVGEKLSDAMALIHIEKANADIPGLYAMINQQYVLHTWQEVDYINREEDMGLPGLRKAKESYYPVCLLDKYDVQLA